MRVFLLAAMLLCLPQLSFAQRAIEPDASIGYGEGNSAGNVTLVMDGGEAVVWGLIEVPQNSGVWRGTGSLVYDGQGISIHDGEKGHFGTARFVVSFVAPPDARATCKNLYAGSIQITGASGYRLVTAPIVWNGSGLCYSAHLPATLVPGQSSFGRLKATYVEKPLRERVTASGRILKP